MNLNKDELEPPAWMQVDFFSDVLKKNEKENFLEIIDYEISPATVQGDHYASIMFRAKVKYLDRLKNEKEITLIIKAMPEEDGTKKDMLEGSKLFETEIRMYTEVIPKLEKILRDAGDQTVLGAKMLYCTLEPRQLIVFEDITKRGYVTIGKRMANLDEAKLALTKLAKWHAASYKYNSENDGVLETFMDGVFNIPGIESNEVFTSGISEVIKLLKTLEGFEDYLPKLEKINKKLLEKCRNTYEKYKSNNLNVLNHGDFHAKNMMFKYDENGKLEDVMLVDFQISVWGSMANDILYSSYMLVDMQTRFNHLDELRYYHFEKFIETLKMIGYKGKLPHYTDLQIDFIKNNHIDLYLLTTFLPMMHLMVNEDIEIDLDKMMESNNYRKLIYQQKSYIHELKSALPKFLYKGFLDGYDD